MADSKNKPKLLMAFSMATFGTIGIFRRYIPLSSSVTAFARGLIGTLFLILFIKIAGKKFSRKAVKANRMLLILSGILIGFNWILLFEAYQYTSIATATLCYYMAPIFVTLASPVLLKERLTLRKLLCVLAALVGMILVSGAADGGFSGINELKGALLGLGAAVLYASIILLNKKIHDISAYDKTIVQLGAATLVLIPYILLTENITEITLTPIIIIMLLIIGILHTGIAYAVYFGTMDSLPAQSIALLAYIDPVVAVILSALLLQEAMGIAEITGTILILGATMVSERQ